MKKIQFVFLFVLFFCFVVKGDSLDDLISYNDRVEIVGGRINEITHEFVLIEALSNTSGIFRVVRRDKIKEDRRIKDPFRDSRGRSYSFEKRQKIRRRIKREDRDIEENRKQINNVTKTVNTIIYIEDVNIRNRAVGDIFTFNDKNLYEIGSVDVSVTRSNNNWGGGRGGFRRYGFGSRKNIHRFTFSKAKAKKYLLNK